MKLVTNFLVSIVATGIALTASARDYQELVAEEYRWVKFDGPYACATKEDLLEITRDPSDLNELHMVEGVRAYLLIQGSIFGDHYVHGMEGVRFYTRLKTVTSR